MYPLESRERRLASIWSAAALACVGLAPAAPILAGLVPPCIWKSLTGVPCPLCGTTRAALALANLEPLYAFGHFPLPTIAWTVFLVGGLAAGLAASVRRPLPLPRCLPRWTGIGLAGAVLVNWIYSIATGV